jgi:hypothetical protein
MTAVKPLRQWRWGNLPTYNGFCHAERVRGWQLTMWMADNGWSRRSATCCISGREDDLQLHSETYYGWEPYTLHRSVHMALHQRFHKPNQWHRIIDQYALTGAEWYSRLAIAPVDLAGALRAFHGPEIVDVFGRAPIPEGVVIHRSQIYQEDAQC